MSLNGLAMACEAVRTKSWITYLRERRTPRGFRQVQTRQLPFYTDVLKQ